MARYCAACRWSTFPGVQYATTYPFIHLQKQQQQRQQHHRLYALTGRRKSVGWTWLRVNKSLSQPSGLFALCWFVACQMSRHPGFHFVVNRMTTLIEMKHWSIILLMQRVKLRKWYRNIPVISLSEGKSAKQMSKGWRTAYLHAKKERFPMIISTLHVTYVHCYANLASSFFSTLKTWSRLVT